MVPTPMRFKETNMLVTRASFQDILRLLSTKQKLSIDTETTGLRPFHGSQLFSIIIGISDSEAFYFNFQAYEDTTTEEILTPNHLQEMRVLFDDPSKIWYAHNFQFDLAMLANKNIHISGELHCTKVVARLLSNQEQEYSLDACAERIGYKKSNAVESFISENKLFSWETIPGKKQRVKNKFYWQVPKNIIVDYGLQDATVCYALGENQSEACAEVAKSFNSSGRPDFTNVLANERRLTKTVFRMNQTGVLIDPIYCKKAIEYENGRIEKALLEFKTLTGCDYKSSGKLFSQVFISEKDKWVFTEKNNPSFDSSVLETFTHPAAKAILEMRDAKSRSDFYEGFLYSSDSKNVMHPNFNQSDTATGRFSASSPNLQNLTAEDPSAEFVIRRAIIPRPGFVFIAPDYKAVEFRFALEAACKLIGYRSPLAELVANGMDFHQSMADLVNSKGKNITRTQAKTVVFSLLYGSGIKHLADGLKCTPNVAREIKQAIFGAAPELDKLITSVSQSAQYRGFITNWLGRKFDFPDPNMAYKATNHLIQGSCADIMKKAMNSVDEYLLDKKSNMLLTVHDELLIEVHESEVSFIPDQIKSIMENAYTSTYVPLTVDMEWSPKSFADKLQGNPI